MSEGLFHGRKCIRFTAYIRPQKSKGIHIFRQKTWRVETDDPLYQKIDIKKMFQHESQRWYFKIMSQIYATTSQPHVAEQDFGQQETNNTNKHNESTGTNS